MKENKKEADDQVGLIQRIQKWMEPWGVEARLWKDMESQWMNYDIIPPSKVWHPDAQWGCLRAGHLQVYVVEFSEESFGPWSPVHLRWGTIHLLQYHSLSSILGTQFVHIISGNQGFSQLHVLQCHHEQSVVVAAGDVW